MKQVSDRNLQLLDQQRQFLQDASHELGTPIAIALGHAELIERAAASAASASASSASDKAIAADARIAVDELLRMRRLTSRMLLLASTDDAAFLHLAPVDTEEVVLETLRRWSHIPRRWSIEVADDTSVLGDADRLTLALDALIENAVDHTEPDDRIELAVRRDGSNVVIAVEDTGSGIPAAEIDRIFSRFSRIDSGRNRATGGFGLGPRDREGDRRGASRLGTGQEHPRRRLGIRAAAARRRVGVRRTSAGASHGGRQRLRLGLAP